MKAKSAILKWLILVAATSGIASAATPGDNKADKDRLQGEWITVSGEMNGKPIDADLVKNQIYEFRGDMLTTKNNGTTLGAASFSLDESKKPKALNVQAGSLGTNPAIYEIKDDELKICMDKPGGTRPTEFKTRPGTSQKLFIFKRKKS